MSNIDPTKPDPVFATTESVRDNFQAAADEIDANTAAAAGAQATADTALANAGTAQGAADAAQATADQAIADAATADGKAVAAQGSADAAQARADDTVPQSAGGQFTGSVFMSASPTDITALQRKDQIDAAIAAAIAAIPPSAVEFPVGAYMLGFDPNGVFPGTWVQTPEGTFLMATVAGADPAGGSNDAILVSHAHTATQPLHNHGPGSMNITGTLQVSDDNGRRSSMIGLSGAFLSGAQGNGAGYSGTGGTQNIETVFNAASAWSGVTSDSNPAITVDAAGVTGTNANRPKYVGVAVWTRTG